MEKLHNLKDSICSYQNLLAAYYEAATDKKYRADVLAFSWNLEENLFSIQEDLQNGTYTVGKYREFYVLYPKPRLVMALAFRDRVVQWAIYRQINPFIDKRFITHSYGCRENKGTLAAAECLLNWIRIISRKPDADEYRIIKLDIAKYFYRVDHAIVHRIYAEYTDDEWFLWLIDTIINNPDVPFGLPYGMTPDDCPRDERLYDVGMPIGNLTSQETANIYLDQLDRYCKYTLRLRYYVRYMDDFCIIVKGQKEAERIMALIGDYVNRELHLALSAKSRILPIRNKIEFVGFDITAHGLRLRKKTVQHIKNSLTHIAGLYADALIDLDTALQVVRCYHGMTKHVNGYALRVWIEQHIALQRKEGMPDGASTVAAENRAAFLHRPRTGGRRGRRVS